MIVTLERECTTKKGLDKQGNYWGVRKVLWRADNGKEIAYFGDVTRQQAENAALKRWPNAEFGWPRW